MRRLTTLSLLIGIVCSGSGNAQEAFDLLKRFDYPIPQEGVFRNCKTAAECGQTNINCAQAESQALASCMSSSRDCLKLLKTPFRHLVLPDPECESRKFSAKAGCEFEAARARLECETRKRLSISQCRQKIEKENEACARLREQEREQSLDALPLFATAPSFKSAALRMSPETKEQIRKAIGLTRAIDLKVYQARPEGGILGAFGIGGDRPDINQLPPVHWITRGRTKSYRNLTVIPYTASFSLGDAVHAALVDALYTFSPEQLAQLHVSKRFDLEQFVKSATETVCSSPKFIKFNADCEMQLELLTE